MKEIDAMKAYCLRAVELKRGLTTEDLPQEALTTLVGINKKGETYTRRLMKKAIKDLNLKSGAAV
ncbi:MAG: hypothetical protein PHS46_08595 [Candidatus Omnitrophica bacterium]|nr:hypothetical protein [Candidatus Omnitrophota bacterium]